MVNKLWSVIFKKWLWDNWNKEYYKVIKVKAWNVALVEGKYGTRITIMPHLTPKGM